MRASSGSGRRPRRSRSWATRSRRGSCMRRAGVPIVPGHDASRSRPRPRSSRLGDEFGWPVAIKAASGGGGKGLKVVERPGEAERRLRRRAARGRGLLRRFDGATSSSYLADPRHVEIQVLADDHGNRPPPRRTGLLHPAAAPEARRGDALAGGDAGPPRAHRPDRGRRRSRGAATGTRARSRGCSTTTATTGSSR